MNARRQSGFTLIEALLSLAIAGLALGSLGSLLIQNSRVNRSQQLKAEVQINARNSLSIIVSKLRSAGWDPRNVGVPTVVLDPLDIDGDHADGVDNIEIFADLNADQETDGSVTDDDDGEQLLIRHQAGRLEWRTKPTGSFEILAVDISNDEDGDGTPEPMFVPDDPDDPSIITVRITAESPVPDPATGQPVRYTVRSDVTLRKVL